MRVRRAQLNTDHSFLFEIIDDVRLIIQQYQLAPRIHLGWTANVIATRAPASVYLKLRGWLETAFPSH